MLVLHNLLELSLHLIIAIEYLHRYFNYVIRKLSWSVVTRFGSLQVVSKVWRAVGEPHKGHNKVHSCMCCFLCVFGKENSIFWQKTCLHSCGGQNFNQLSLNFPFVLVRFLVAISIRVLTCHSATQGWWTGSGRSSDCWTNIF